MFRKFKLNIISRVVFIIILVVGIVLSFNSGFYITGGFVCVALAFTVGNMIYYVNQTNRDLANFLAAVKYEDFVTNSSGFFKGKSFDDLHSSFNLINSKFRDIRAEKEANHQFLQTLVEHVDIGILCTNKDGEVILMNKALQKLLGKSYLLNLNGLKKIDEKLWHTINEMKNGQRSLLKINIKNKLLQLSIQSVDMRLQKEPYRLVSFQNIQNELEAQELIAWQKLIRILTHEIMNSVAPIASLSASINDLVTRETVLSESNLNLIKQSMGVIHKRSEGLLDFTETYRSLTRIPPPKFKIIDIRELISEVETLLKVQLKEKKILFEKQFVGGEVSCQGDPHLLEQVLINLVKNAIEALEEEENPKIIVSSKTGIDGKTMIKILDNGPGIPKDKMEQIFVPFFTTKSNGSGIGLSLSRQILRMHKGSLNIQSEEGQGTLVEISL